MQGSYHAGSRRWILHPAFAQQSRLGAIPAVPRKQIEALAAGDWIETGANLIAIGNSGAGKTHLLCAIGHALIEAGRRVLYTRTTDLVQRLQAARRDLMLEPTLAKLDRFDLSGMGLGP